MVQYMKKEVSIMQQITIKSYETKKSLITPIIFLLIGVLLFTNPGGVVEFISYIFGGVFIALGVGKLIMDSRRNDKTTGDTFYSIIMIVLGLIFICFSGTIEFIVRLAIGVWIIINALNTLAIGSNLMRIDKHNVVTIILGFILLIMGIYTIVVANLVLETLGLVLIIYSVLEIIDYFYILAKNK